MYVTRDSIYYNSETGYMTEEYMEHNGHFEKSTNTWKICGREMKMFQDKDVAYEYGSRKIIKCNYSQLFTDYDNLIIANSLYEKFDDMFGPYANEQGYYEEYDNIYQYYIIDKNLADHLERHTEEIILYSEELDLYLLCVTHYGTCWDYVPSFYVL